MAASDHSTGKFPTTSWTLIQKVQHGSEGDAQKAMEEICRAYWYPIYAFARRLGESPHNAEDLTQAMFEKLLTHDTLQNARSEQGRLRSFLITILKQVISNDRRGAATLKRGGGVAAISINEMLAEERYTAEPADISDPEKLFDRAWAQSILQAAEARLRKDFEANDNIEILEALQEFLPFGANETPQATLAARLGMKHGTLRMQISRMRQMYASFVDDEISQTVGDPSELARERDYLISLVSRV